MTSDEIQRLLKERESELEQVKAAHDVMWAKGSQELRSLQQQHQRLQEKMQTEGGQNQLKITRLEGMIAAYKELLPKPEPPSDSKPETPPETV